jgi:hypothetical protein
MSEANKTITVAFYKQALLEGDVENAFRAFEREQEMKGVSSFYSVRGQKNVNADYSLVDLSQ